MDFLCEITPLSVILSSVIGFVISGMLWKILRNR